jgi:hypothetical protein
MTRSSKKPIGNHATLNSDGLVDRFIDQLLIVLLKRLGGQIDIPIKEVDATEMDLMAFELIDGHFRLTLRKKS